jgi:hypothetical protein
MLRVGRKYKLLKTAKIYELVKIDKKQHATWIYVSANDKDALCYGKRAFEAQFEEVR